MANIKLTLLYLLCRLLIHTGLVSLYLYTSWTLSDGKTVAVMRNVRLEQIMNESSTNSSGLVSRAEVRSTASGNNGEGDKSRRQYGDSLGGSWRFLTTWNYTLQIIYFSMSVVVDVWLLLHTLCCAARRTGQTDPPGRSSSGSGFKGYETGTLDAIFHSLITPLAIYVFFIFWTVYLYDRELIFPSFLDAMIPWWVNHVMHTVIVGAALLESLVVYHHPPPLWLGLGLGLIVNVVYSSWTLFLGIGYGSWVYGFLAVLNWPGRIALYSLSLAGCAAVYLAGVELHTRWWHLIDTKCKRSSTSSRDQAVVHQFGQLGIDELDDVGIGLNSAPDPDNHHHGAHHVHFSDNADDTTTSCPIRKFNSNQRLNCDVIRHCSFSLDPIP